MMEYWNHGVMENRLESRVATHFVHCFRTESLGEPFASLTICFTNYASLCLRASAGKSQTLATCGNRSKWTSREYRIKSC